MRARITVENIRRLRKTLPEKGRTRCYASPEGIAACVFRFPIGPRQSVRQVILHDVSEVEKQSPQDAFKEGNFLFPPPENREGYNRWKGKDRIQTYPHRKKNLVVTMLRIADRLVAKRVRPDEIMIRVGIRGEGGKPFDRKTPKKKKRGK